MQQWAFTQKPSLCFHLSWHVQGDECSGSILSSGQGEEEGPSANSRRAGVESLALGCAANARYQRVAWGAQHVLSCRFRESRQVAWPKRKKKQWNWRTELESNEVKKWLHILKDTPKKLISQKRWRKKRRRRNPGGEKRDEVRQNVMDTEERVNASSSEEREQGLHLSSFISCCPRASQVSFTRAVTAYTWPNTSASNGQVARTHMLSLSHTHTRPWDHTWLFFSPPTTAPLSVWLRIRGKNLNSTAVRLTCLKQHYVTFWT